MLKLHNNTRSESGPTASWTTNTLS